METINESGRLGGSLTDYFTLQNRLLSTRTADLHSAIERATSRPLAVWVLRYPLAAQSDAMRRFLDRLRAIQKTNNSGIPILTFGVDRHGVAFAALPHLDGGAINSTRTESVEGERRYTECLRLVEGLHRQGIVCGDICGSSFWLERQGDVSFIGVMGSFDIEAAATASAPPLETLQFLPPEQRNSGTPEQASDVYALGVLGYLLITGVYPGGNSSGPLGTSVDLSRVRSINEYTTRPPVWGDEVLMRCMDPDPANRYRSAGEVLTAVWESRNKSAQTEAPAVMTPGGGKSKRQEIYSHEKPLDLKRKTSTSQSNQTKTSDATPWKKRAYLMVIIFVATFAIVLIDKVSRNTGSTLPADLASHQQALGDQQMRTGIQVLSQDSASREQREEYLRKFVESDDPLSHDVLVKSALNAPNKSDRIIAEKAVLDRIKRLGLVTTADVVKEWLEGITPEGAALQKLPSSYENVLQAVNPSLPQEVQESMLVSIREKEPSFGTRLIASLVIDSETPQNLSALLTQAIGSELSIEGMSDISSLALLLYHPGIGPRFSQRIIARAKDIPDRDILWLLGQLAVSADERSKAISKIALERKLLTPLRKNFIEVISSDSQLPAEIVAALAGAASGRIADQDIGTLGAWFDVRAGKLLLAICADNTDDAIVSKAFDAAMGKTINEEPAASIIEWIKAEHWSERAKFARLIAVVTFPNEVGSERIGKEIDGVKKYLGEEGLFSILMSRGDLSVITHMLSDHGDLFGLAELLQLLNHKNKEVRILGIQNLKKYNDITALRLIKEAYENEKDPDVLNAYKETFWMLK